jgi:hypothetical protein
LINLLLSPKVTCTDRSTSCWENKPTSKQEEEALQKETLTRQSTTLL